MSERGDKSELSAFTEQALELLVKHMSFLQSLHDGSRPAETDAQRHFVLVCKGLAKPETAHEVAFVQWLVGRPTVREMKLRLADIREERIKRARFAIGSTSSQTAKRSSTKSYAAVRAEVERRYLAPVDAEPDKLSLDEIAQRERDRQARVDERRAKEPPAPKKDFTPRKIVETRGTRDDWRKDNGRNKFNGR